jgi:hypothetical protein
MIHFYELRELVMNGGIFTWSNNQDPPILEKLDKILVTKECEDIFPQVCVNKSPREISDHNPLVLTTGKCDNLPHIQFNLIYVGSKTLNCLFLLKRFGISLVRPEQQLIRFNKNSSYSNNFLRVGGLTCKEK